MFPRNWELFSSAPSDAIGWFHHRLVLVAAQDSSRPLVVTVGLSLDLGRSRSSIQIAVLGLGDPIVISELDGPLPGRGLELRTSGLWAEFICETPFSHWSYGLEAFALAIDDPTELLGRGFGQRVPLGWELEFESEEEPEWLGSAPSGERRPAVGAYRQLGIAHGLLLTADGERELEGRALRSQSWGSATPGGQTVPTGEPVLAAETVLADGHAAPGNGQPLDQAADDGPVALPGFHDVWWVERSFSGVTTWNAPYDSPSSRRLS